MEDFVFYNKTRLIFGKNAELRFVPYLPKGVKRILIHYGGGSAIRSGLIPRVETMLADHGYETVRLGGVQANPRLTFVQKGIALCRKEKIDFILAVGGGSVIDSAKAISFGVHYDGDVWDFFGTGKKAENLVPVGCVLTIPASGSECSLGSVITNEQGLKRCGEGVDSRPLFAAMNPALTCTLPAYQTACGAADIMAHILERYFTAVEHCDLSNELCEGALRSVVRNTRLVMENPQDLDARAELMLAGTVAQNDVLGMGRISDWGSHMIEHELSGLYDIAHGAGLTIVFPAWMRYLYKDHLPIFARYARTVWNVQEEDDAAAALAGIQATEQFWASLGLPIRLREIQVTDVAVLEKMAGSATATRTLGRLKALDYHDVLEILKLAM